MRIFDEPNISDGFTCPICGNGDIKPVTLVGILETLKDYNMEAVQVHVDCLDLNAVKMPDTGKSYILHTGEFDLE